MAIKFFMAMEPPTATHQEHKVAVIKGRPVIYDGPELKAARQKLLAPGKAQTQEADRNWLQADGEMVLPQREPRAGGIPHHETGYRQPAEAFEGLHDSLWLLER